MRKQLAGLALLSAVVSMLVAGCDAGGAGGVGRALPHGVAAATGAATTGPSPVASGGSGCDSSPAEALEPGALTGAQFVSADQGWVVGQDVILATADGGAHWQVQRSGRLNLTAVDFVNGQDGWAAGNASLLATTDGGAHWTALPEPCPLIRSVHFISPSTGFAVAGGRNDGGFNPAMPNAGGVLLTTSDAGRTWRPLAAPVDAQSVCFSDPAHGWLGAGGRLYRTVDGGGRWSGPLTPATGGTEAGYTAVMSVQCAGDGSAWALSIGPGAAMSQQEHTGYYANAAGAKGIFAEGYFPGPNPPGRAPGSYAGPFSALSPSAAVFIDFCPACGPGTAPWDVVTGSGATLTVKGNVGLVNVPDAASFLSATSGWVAGTAREFTDTGKSREQQRIVATTDGGRTWQLEYATPWTPWTG
jgi:Photosynthesis system II assembly factor YCF48